MSTSRRRASHPVLRYALRRLLTVFALLLVLSFGIFSLLYLAPGDPVSLLIGPQSASPEQVESIRQKYHLDEPFLTQYWIWLTNAFQLDFGNSVQTSLPVSTMLIDRLPVSLKLGLYAYLLTAAFGIALGVVSALRHRGIADRVISGVSLVFMSAPPFVVGIALLYFFTVVFPVFPTSPRGGGFWAEVRYLTLPATAMAMAGLAYMVKHTRTALARVLGEDYVTFAKARGLSFRETLFRYGMRNALIPIITVAAPLLAFMLTGAVFVEVVFSLPGIGQLLVQSALTRDMPMLQGVALVVASIILLANLAADLAYLAADPRVRVGGVSA